MKKPNACPDTVLARLSGRTTPALSEQASGERGMDVPVSGGRSSVDRTGAERGLIVKLGTAVAIRARFSGRPAIAQDARSKHPPTRDSVLMESCSGCLFERIIQSKGRSRGFPITRWFEKPRPPGKYTPRGQTGAPVTGSVDRGDQVVKAGI